MVEVRFVPRLPEVDLRIVLGDRLGEAPERLRARFDGARLAAVRAPILCPGRRLEDRHEGSETGGERSLDAHVRARVDPLVGGIGRVGRRSGTRGSDVAPVEDDPRVLGDLTDASVRGRHIRRGRVRLLDGRQKRMGRGGGCRRREKSTKGAAKNGQKSCLFTNPQWFPEKAGGGKSLRTGRGSGRPAA